MLKFITHNMVITHVKSLFFVLFTLVLISSSTAQAPDILNLKIGTIRLSDPLIGVKATLKKGDKVIQTSITGKRGTVSFDIICDGDYKLYFSKKGFVTSYIDILASQSIDVADFFESLFSTQILMIPNKDKPKFNCEFTTPSFLIVFEPNKKGNNGKYIEQEFTGKKGKKCDDEKPKEPLKEKTSQKLNLLTISGLIQSKTNAIPIRNKSIVLEDFNGNIIETSKTTTSGRFVFSKLPENIDFKIIVDDKEQEIKDIIIKLKSGDMDDILTASKELNMYTFKIPNNEKELIKLLTKESENVKMNLSGYIFGVSSLEEFPLSKVHVSLVNKEGVVVNSTITNNNGKFKFHTHHSKEKYTIRINESDLLTQNLVELILKNREKETIKKSKITESLKAFEFELLPQDITTLAEIYVEDPWMEIADGILDVEDHEIKIVEKIPFEVNASTMKPAAIPTIENIVYVLKNNPTIKIEIGAHSDARGEAAYNLSLSQKRANSVKGYFVKKGIDANRLTAKGYGETQLLNKCNDATECTEEEHAKNRRVEFKVLN